MKFAVFALALLLATGCQRSPKPLVMSATTNVEGWTLQDFSGRRDGDRFDGKVTIGDAAHHLVLSLQLKVGAPTTFTAGTWTLDGSPEKPATARSVEFLGGQDDGPSVGGVFDLGDFEVRLPVTKVKALR